jgi:hypothetical protein
MDEFNKIQEKLKKSDEKMLENDQEIHYGDFYDR